MYDATDNIPTADEIIAAVHDLQDRYRAALEERDELRAPSAEHQDRQVKVFSMDRLPHDRDFTFFEDLALLVVSPDMDDDTHRRPMARVEPPRLTTCDVCGAPVWRGVDRQMH